MRFDLPHAWAAKDFIKEIIMTDSLVQGLTAALGGKVSGEIIIFIISMIPILELRGGLLAASPALLNVPIFKSHSHLHHRKPAPDSLYPAFD